MAKNTNAFTTAQNNRFTRKWGGSTQDVVDPYVSGYFFTHFAYVPVYLDTYVTANKVSGETINVSKLLSSTCLSVTLPGATVNKAEFIGLGGIRFAVPTNVEWDNTVSLRFLEFSNLPILTVIHSWVKMIRDYKNGVSNLGVNGTYTKSQYSATMYYWTTEPNGVNVEYYACLTGMYPLKDPTDLYSGDLATNDKLEVDIDFNVDYIWHETWVKDRCQKLADTFYSEGTALTGVYGNDGTYGPGNPNI